MILLSFPNKYRRGIDGSTPSSDRRLLPNRYATRFADRVAVGINAGGGIGFSSGTVTTQGTFSSTFTNPPQPPTITNEVISSTGDAAGDVIGKYVVLAKVELKASVRVGGGCRVFGAFGMNAPSAVAGRFGVVYLIGGR